MECPKCGAVNENPLDSCLSCGAPLPVEDAPDLPTRIPVALSMGTGSARLQTSGGPPKQCPGCGTLNAAAFKFCARCGSPLAASAASAPELTAPGPGAAARQGPPPLPKSPPSVGRPAPAAARPPPPQTAPKAPAGRPPGKVAPVSPAEAAVAAMKATPMPGAPPPRPPPAVAAAKVAPRPAPTPPPRMRARVSAIARDGSCSADFLLTRDETRVGSAVADGEVKLDRDRYVSPVHATFRFEGEQLTIEDGGTPNGVFLWIKQRTLQPGDELRLGRQRLRLEALPDEPEELAEQIVWGSPNPGYQLRLVQLLESGGEGDVFPLRPGENLLGRGGGDVSFPGDGYVSSRHATLSVTPGELRITDLGSANGTFIRLAQKTILQPGDLLLVGDQILRIDPA